MNNSAVHGEDYASPHDGNEEVAIFSSAVPAVLAATPRQLAEVMTGVVDLADEILDHPAAADHPAAGADLRSDLASVSERLEAAHEKALGERATAAAMILVQVLDQVLLAPDEPQLERWSALAMHVLCHVRRDLARIRRQAEAA